MNIYGSGSGSGEGGEGSGGDGGEGGNTMVERAALEEVYAGVEGLELGLLYDKPDSVEELIDNYLTSKLWRLNNLYTVINKDGERVPFVMNLSQHKVYAAILTWYRIIILKSRQQGISTFWLLCFLDDAMFYDDLNIGLMAQGKSEADKLLKKVKLAWRSLDDEVKDVLGGLGLDVDKKEEIAFTNNSSIYIAVSFRSGTLQRLHVSELGKIANNFPKRARELKTGSLQAIKVGNPIVIESTAEGDNMFSSMWDAAVESEARADVGRGDKDFMPVFLSWIYDKDCVSRVKETVTEQVKEYFIEIEEEMDTKLSVEQKNFWVMQERELGQDIYQEYPSTPTEAFIAVRDGTYYASLYFRHIVQGKRLLHDLFDPTLSVLVAMDLGMNDTFVLIFYQKWGKEIRIIDEYTNHGLELAHYVDIMKNTKYKISTVEIPHDGAVRELQTGKRRKAHLRDLGVVGLYMLPRSNIEDGIEKVRQMLKNTWLDTKCIYVKTCLTKYTKQYDEEHNVWRDKPLHNEASNGADTLRVIAMGQGKDSIKLDLVPLKSSASHGTVVDGTAF